MNQAQKNKCNLVVTIILLLLICVNSIVLAAIHEIKPLYQTLLSITNAVLSLVVSILRIKHKSAYVEDETLVIS